MCGRYAILKLQRDIVDTLAAVMIDRIGQEVDVKYKTIHIVIFIIITIIIIIVFV